MKISQREMVLGVTTLAMVLIGFTYYLGKKKLETHKASKIRITELQQQIRIDENRIKMQDEWMAELNELQEGLRVFDINQGTPSPELMKTIKEISSRHELDITRSQPHNETPTDDLFEMGINCTWEGELPAMVGFLAELQQQGVRYDVRTLNVTPVGKNTGRLKGNMVIHCAYTKREIPPEVEEAPQQ